MMNEENISLYISNVLDQDQILSEFMSKLKDSGSYTIIKETEVVNRHYNIYTLTFN